MADSQNHTYCHTPDAFRDLIGELTGGYPRVFYLFDENTHKHCSNIFKGTVAEPLPENTYVLPAGESSKTLAYAEKIWTFMLEKGAGRDAVLINTGGGLVCDLGGLVASLFKRGIAFIHVPASLLAMVDAAFGGKTAVNFAGLKNQIGTFTLPIHTIVYPGFLETLPEREFNSGMAEMFKHGLISGRNHWEQLLEIKNRQELMASGLIRESARIKMQVIEEDFLEQGRRKVLNLGHTIGHALESAFSGKGKNAMLHGEAVAHGIGIEACLAVIKGLLPEMIARETAGEMKNRYPALDFQQVNKNDLFRLLKGDKKNAGAKLQFVLMEDIGRPVIDVVCSTDEIAKALKQYEVLLE